MPKASADHDATLAVSSRFELYLTGALFGRLAAASSAVKRCSSAVMAAAGSLYGAGALTRAPARWVRA